MLSVSIYPVGLASLLTLAFLLFRETVRLIVAIQAIRKARRIDIPHVVNALCSHRIEFIPAALSVPQRTCKRCKEVPPELR